MWNDILSACPAPAHYCIFASLFSELQKRVPGERRCPVAKCAEIIYHEQPFERIEAMSPDSDRQFETILSLNKTRDKKQLGRESAFPARLCGEGAAPTITRPL